jgi:hypothetical protein
MTMVRLFSPFLLLKSRRKYEEYPMESFVRRDSGEETGSGTDVTQDTSSRCGSGAGCGW